MKIIHPLNALLYFKVTHSDIKFLHKCAMKLDFKEVNIYCP